METNGEDVSAQSVPHPALKRLDAIVGTWNTEWRSVDDPTIIHGTDTYEWQTNGFFLIHHVSSRMPFGLYDVLEVIGNYNPETSQYAIQSFDSQGNTLSQQLHIDEDGVWTFTGETMRARLIIDPDGNNMKAHWEQKKAGANWTPWLDMTFSRNKS